MVNLAGRKTRFSLQNKALTGGRAQADFLNDYNDLRLKLIYKKMITH